MSEQLDVGTAAPPMAFVALGANLGGAWQTVLDALARLQELSDAPLRKSSLWRTSPVNCPADSPVFVNAVAGLEPRAGETPESLLAKLQSLEKEFGRKPKPERNAPRPLDLDLIAFGGETRATPELTLPHPRVAQRRFVLLPLSEIAPDLVLPGEKLTADELFDRLPVKDSVEWLASPA